MNSGYRCVVHNEVVGGVSNSLHRFGLAADLRLTDELYRDFAEFHYWCGYKRLRVIHKKNYVHLEFDRGRPSLIGLKDSHA